MPRHRQQDCEFIDQYMTKYSWFDHSQPSDSPAPNIGYEELIEDYNKLIDFAKAMKKKQSDFEKSRQKNIYEQ